MTRTLLCILALLSFVSSFVAGLYFIDKGQIGAAALVAISGVAWGVVMCALVIMLDRLNEISETVRTGAFDKNKLK